MYRQTYICTCIYGNWYNILSQSSRPLLSWWICIVKPMSIAHLSLDLVSAPEISPFVTDTARSHRYNILDSTQSIQGRSTEGWQDSIQEVVVATVRSCINLPGKVSWRLVMCVCVCVNWRILKRPRLYLRQGRRSRRKCWNWSALKLGKKRMSPMKSGWNLIPSQITEAFRWLDSNLLHTIATDGSTTRWLV